VERLIVARLPGAREIQAAYRARPYKLRSNSADCLKQPILRPNSSQNMLTSFSKSERSSKLRRANLGEVNKTNLQQQNMKPNQLLKYQSLLLVICVAVFAALPFVLQLI
jgi:hypothetical protein